MGQDETSNWKTIFEQYGTKMLMFARQFAANRSDAEDIVQEAFTRFWKSNRREEENFIPLLFGCVRWAALDWLRRNRRREKREEIAGTYDRIISESRFFECSIEKEETGEAVQEALQKLPDPQREVVALKIWGELTFDQIGRTLQISANTAASRYRYALAALKKSLKHLSYVG